MRYTRQLEKKTKHTYFDKEEKRIKDANKVLFGIAGFLGFIPFYKNAKDYVGWKDFKGEKAPN